MKSVVLVQYLETTTPQHVLIKSGKMQLQSSDLLCKEAVEPEGEPLYEEDDDDCDLHEGEEDVGDHDDVDAEEGELAHVRHQVHPRRRDGHRPQLPLPTEPAEG